MKALAEFLIAGLELVEAEGRQLRLTLFRFGVALALVVLALAVAVAGTALLAVGAFLGLQALLGDRTWAAALVSGFLFVLVAGTLAWIASRLVK